MQLTKKTISQRIQHAADHNHGLRLDPQDVPELLGLYQKRGAAVPPRFQTAADKRQGLRLSRETAKTLQSIAN